MLITLSENEHRKAIELYMKEVWVMDEALITAVKKCKPVVIQVDLPKKEGK